MPEEERITVKAEVDAYVSTARAMYGLDEELSAIEVTDPPVVVRTPDGAKVMAWLPVADEDRDRPADSGVG